MNRKLELGPEERTARGFRFVRFRDQYGEECSIQNSSLESADGPCLWLGLDSADPKIMQTDAKRLGMALPGGPVEGWMPYPIPEEVLLSTRMHLNRKQVRALAATLNRWLRTGSFVGVPE